MSEDQPGAEEFAANAIGGEGIVGNYIVIAEMMHEDGVTLSFAISDNMPPWTAMGMIQSVASMIDVATYGFAEVPEDDEDV